MTRPTAKQVFCPPILSITYRESPYKTVSSRRSTPHAPPRAQPTVRPRPLSDALAEAQPTAASTAGGPRGPHPAGDDHVDQRRGRLVAYGRQLGPQPYADDRRRRRDPRPRRGRAQHHDRV